MNALRNLLALALVLLVLAPAAMAQTKKKSGGSKTKARTSTQAKKPKATAKPNMGEEVDIQPQTPQPPQTPPDQSQIQPNQPQVQAQPEQQTQMAQSGGSTARAEQGDNGLNPNSARPIPESDIMYKVTNWRRMDLREKINQPFFSKNNEITKYLIDGFRAGLLKAYKNDSLTTEVALEDFNTNLRYENTEGGLSDEEKAAGFGKASTEDDGWGGSPKKDAKATAQKGGTTKPAAGEDDGWGGNTTAKNSKNAAPATGKKPGAPAANESGWGDEPSAGAAGGPIEYFATELPVIEIKEDFIFDRKRSRAYNDIQALTIIIPAEKTARGFDVPVASFRYKDVAAYFRSNPSKFIWYNSLNQAQHKNMADAFDLRLFNARIIKQSNANDAFLTDIYGGEKAGLIKSQQLEYKLMEFEHNLWEY
jgi:hypothetical protein